MTATRDTDDRDGDLAALRAEVRAFVARMLPDDIRVAVVQRRNLTRAQAQRWQKILHAAGWGAPGWPKAFGGTGWPIVKQAVLQEELALAGAPPVESLGLSTIGPTIIRHGTPEQQARYLPGILAFDDFWAQAYSEPGAGSDLASLQCSARREGDHYVVNGTKIWQSHAHWANRAFTLVRVAPDEDAAAGERRRKQDGITVLLLHLDAPGVTVRPIRFMHGRYFHSQLFFDDVRVPVADRVGEEGRGWSIAKDLLVVERLFGGRVAECRVQLDNLAALARTHGSACNGGSDLFAQSWFARRVAALEIRYAAYHAAWWDAVAAVQAGEQLDVEVSKLRLVGTVLLQDIFGLELEVAGSHGLLAPPGDAPDDDALAQPAITPDHVENLHALHFRHRGITLGSGSAEVQRDIIARDVFERGTPGDRTRWESEDQRLLHESVTRFLARHHGMEQRRAIISSGAGGDGSVWRELAGLGVLGLLAPEAVGGSAGSVGDMAVVAEAMGAALVVEPWLWTVALAACQPRLEAEAARELARSLVAGTTRAALAYLEADARFEPGHCRTQATWRDGAWHLAGEKCLVWAGATADVLLVTARVQPATTRDGDGNADPAPADAVDTGDWALFQLDAAMAGLAITPLRTYDGRAVARLSIAATVPAQALLARGEAAWRLVTDVLERVTLGTVAEAIGAMDRSLCITIDYMKARRQFGQPIAGFQALRHRVVEHCLALYTLRSLARLATTALAQDDAGAVDAIAAAKWLAGLAARQVGHDVLQLHGAVGFQDETPISHYARRLVATDALLGDSEWQLSRWCARRAGWPAR